MNIIADLQIHSKYSRAVSQEMIIPKIWDWAKRKGIGLMATGDWTHPMWMREIKANLEETGNGLCRLKKNALSALNEVTNKWEDKVEEDYNQLFLLATEVSSIYTQGGKSRRIHTLIWSPTIETAEKINKALFDHGCNLMSDGRPIIGLTCIQVTEIALTVDPTCLIIPAHAWTPWFSLYGSESGFDSIEECFGKYSKYIYAIETGLSSNPAMNWRIKDLDNRSILSFSDAHSGPKLGREATVFDLEEISYKTIRRAIMRPYYLSQNEMNKVTDNKIAYTIEFYPEEGKYHYTGHRSCLVKQTPEETVKKGTICPVCGKKLTVGVMHRVEQLAGRIESVLKIKKKELPGTQVKAMYSEAFSDRPPFIMLVPLQEILAECIGSTIASQSLQNEYKKLTDDLGGEFNVLLKAKAVEIEKISGSRVAEGIVKVRNGDIDVDPGYDGVFGVVKIWGDKKEELIEDSKDQLSLF